MKKGFNVSDFINSSAKYSNVGDRAGMNESFYEAYGEHDVLNRFNGKGVLYYFDEGNFHYKIGSFSPRLAYTYDLDE